MDIGYDPYLNIHILFVIYSDVKVKDKDLKVGKGACHYDVMTMCCVMGRAGQCQIP